MQASGINEFNKLVLYRAIHGYAGLYTAIQSRVVLVQTAWKELFYCAILNINLCIHKMISKGHEVARIPTTKSCNERSMVKSSAECFGC